jgi:hypothetical protein
MEIEAGFLILKTYERLYRDYQNRYNLEKPFYAIPRIDQKPSDFRIQYRGLDRDALDPYRDSENLAEIRMYELEKESKCEDGFIFTEEAVHDVCSYLSDPLDYETVWTRIAHLNIAEPKGFKSIGYEPTYFTGDHFSASCDCMLIPRWHGTDKEGTLFLEYFKQLNQYGLFPSPKKAKKFLDFYLSFDWTETGEYEIAEIFIQEIE